MYELTYIINPNLSETEISAQTDKVRTFISQSGGEIKYEKLWEKRRLSYPIKKQGFGFFATVSFNMPAENVDELGKQLKFEPQILRFLLIVEDVVKKTRKTAWRPMKPKAKAEQIFKKPVQEPQDEKVKIEEIDKKLEELLEA